MFDLFARCALAKKLVAAGMAPIWASIVAEANYPGGSLTQMYGRFFRRDVQDVRTATKEFIEERDSTDVELIYYLFGTDINRIQRMFSGLTLIKLARTPVRRTRADTSAPVSPVQSRPGSGAAPRCSAGRRLRCRRRRGRRSTTG
jgi:hypothetical protein